MCKNKIKFYKNLYKKFNQLLLSLIKTVSVVFLILSAFISCSIADDDCICTTEFRYYTVSIVDTLKVPVDSLTVSVKDKNGNELNISQENQIFGPGNYIVFNDSFTTMFISANETERIIFTASDGIRNVQGEYLFGTDRCRCHINKVSGPDTLVIR